MYFLKFYEICKFLFRVALFYHHNLIFRVDFSVNLFKFLTLGKWKFFEYNEVDSLVKKTLFNLSSLLYFNPFWISKLENLFNVISVNVCCP